MEKVKKHPIKISLGKFEQDYVGFESLYDVERRLMRELYSRLNLLVPQEFEGTLTLSVELEYEFADGEIFTWEEVKDML